MSEVQSSHVVGDVPQLHAFLVSSPGGPPRGAKPDEADAVFFKRPEPDAACAVRDAPLRWPRVFPGL